MRIKSGVYKIICKPTGDTYIGSTNNFSARWSSHRCDIRKDKKKGLFKILAKRYMVEDFLFEVLEYVPDIANLIDREQFYIDTLKPTLNISKNAYNPSLDSELPKVIMQGQDASAAKYTNEIYKRIFLAVWRHSDKTAIEINAMFPQVSLRVVRSIHGLEKHSWLQKEFPNEYSDLLSRKRSRINKKFTTRELYDPSGILHSFSNMSQFCREHTLSQPKVSEVLNGSRAHHKGWTRSPDKSNVKVIRGK